MDEPPVVAGKGRGGAWSGDRFGRAQQNWANSNRGHFEQAREEMQASIRRYLENNSNAENDSSSDEEFESEPILTSVLKSYSDLIESQEGLEKIRQILENSFQSGAATCLICICSIKRMDPIWSCIECYGFYHIQCIQKWSNSWWVTRQDLDQEVLLEFRTSKKNGWPCPKCRHEYEKTEIPQKYVCFCGKVQDPPNEPFLVPHSCGERCDKLLKPECGHSCLLLCHPGPCPPCPQVVNVYCHCKKSSTKVQRCSNKFWSCGGKCRKLLLCKKHYCEEQCHAGECPPCNSESVQDCNCGSQRRKQPCMTPDWQCGKVCGKPLSCGYHKCEIICHKGECGDCPRSLERTCPCGKSAFRLSCTEEIPACNETCGKLLECGTHYCEQKCHKDKCGMCLEVVTKVCRCGLQNKTLPCQKEYLCNRKCQKMKSCKRHLCNRKCCDGKCPPCNKQCGRMLSCGNHKCPAECHVGACYPCPQVVQVACRCGTSVITVPCGRKKTMKPPRCNKSCKVPPNCHHPSREPHRCHFGECPPCQQICGKQRKRCSHNCPAPCHSAVWQEINKNARPADPWEAAQVQYKRCNLPCPDCDVPVMVPCLGGHCTMQKPCHKSEPTPCSRECGRLLACENHRCVKTCHQVLGAGDSLNAGENCSECMSACLKKRPEGCTHKCPEPCHPGDCPPCLLNLKLKCHCGIGVLYLRCSTYFSASAEVREALLSCGNACPKSYACGHPCQATCHSGKCPNSELCKKKVKLTCKCKQVKSVVTCDLIRAGAVQSVECNDECFEKAKAQREAKEEELAKKKMEEERRNREEVEKFEKKFQGRKKHRDRNQSVESTAENERMFLLRYWYVLVPVFIVILASTVFYMTP